MVYTVYKLVEMENLLYQGVGIILLKYGNWRQYENLFNLININIVIMKYQYTFDKYKKY